MTKPIKLSEIECASKYINDTVNLALIEALRIAIKFIDKQHESECYVMCDCSLKAGWIKEEITKLVDMS